MGDWRLGCGCMSSSSNEHLHMTSLVESLQYELLM